jgi:hypothetical protein
LEGEVYAAFTSEAAEVGAPETRSNWSARTAIDEKSISIRRSGNQDEKNIGAPTFGAEQQKADGTAALKRVGEIVWRC